MRVSSEPVWTMFRPGLDHTLLAEFTIHVNRTDTKGLGRFTSEIFVIIFRRREMREIWARLWLLHSAAPDLARG